MSTPNYKPGVGRLTTDRFDFQKHLNGADFRHNATQIDLFPTVVIDGYTKTTVQDAVEKLSTLIAPPSVPDATTSIKGIVQLVGDIGGTATNVAVIGLQQRPISTLAPSTNDVLTWNGIAWIPQPNTTSFVAAGDLAGTNTSQTVTKLTGAFGGVRVLCNIVEFDAALTTPYIHQASTVSANGANLIIQGQSAANNGGDVEIRGGFGGLTNGSVSLMSDSTYMVEAATLIPSNVKILSLLNPSPVSLATMPSGTGDRVIYIKDAATTPSIGANPIGGSILYSSGGKLYVKQSDGINFAVGTTTNPFILGSSTQQLLINQAAATSITNAPVYPYFYNIPINTSVYTTATFIGKKVGTNDTAQFTLRAGFTRQGGAASSVSTVTIVDSRTTGGAAGWSGPDIALSGNAIVFFSGYDLGTTINWVIISELTIVTA